MVVTLRRNTVLMPAKQRGGLKVKTNDQNCLSAGQMDKPTMKKRSLVRFRRISLDNMVRVK